MPSILSSSLHIDNDLLYRFRQGDELAFEQLHKAHSVTLLQIAYRKTGLLEVAEELVQDTFLSFYQKRNSINDKPLLYLKAILKHKLLDYVKAKKNIYFSDLETLSIAADAISSHDNLEAKETYATIYSYVKQLPDQCQRVFILSRENNLSNKQIADELGISVKSVEANITRALKYLREHLDYKWLWIAILLGG